MSTPADMAERHARILAELSELGLTVARDLQARVLAADDIKSASDAALALHRISRSVRQTLALEAKLERDRQRDLAQEAVRTAERDQAARKHRKTQADAAISRLIWSEADRDEDLDAGEMLVELSRILDEEAFADTFLDEPVEALIARICETLGVPSPLVGERACPRESGDGRREPDG